MWAMKNLYINNLDSLTEDEQVEFWYNNDKDADVLVLDTFVSYIEALNIFWTY